MTWDLELDFLLRSCQYLSVRLQFLYQSRKKLALVVSRSLANLTLCLWKSMFLLNVFSKHSRNPSGSLLPAGLWHIPLESRQWWCDGCVKQAGVASKKKQ